MPPVVRAPSQRGLALRERDACLGKCIEWEPSTHVMEKRGRSMHSDVPTCGALGAADVDLQFGSESRTESDPPAPDPLEDMDCGEDR